MSTELSPYVPTNLDSALAIAERLANSGMLPGIRNRDQAFAVMATGAEMGLGPMLSLRSIVMVNGKPTLSAELMLRLVIENGVKHHWVHTDNERAELRLTRDGHEPFFSKFSIDDARRAGLLKKPGPWHQYPANMCRARVISNGVRAYCPDLLTGVYVTGELDDVPRNAGPMQDVTPPAEPRKFDRDATTPAEPHKWTPEEQKRFFAHLKEDNKVWAAAGHAEVDYNDLGDFLEALDTPRPRPSRMQTDKQRATVLKWLGSDAGRKKYWGWMDAREGLADDVEEVPDADFEEVPDTEPAALVKLWEAIELLIKDGGQAAIDVVGTFDLDLSVEGVRSIRDENKLTHLKHELDKLAVTDPAESPC